MSRSTRSAPLPRLVACAPSAAGAAPLAGASRFICCDPVASAMVSLVQLRNWKLTCASSVSRTCSSAAAGMPVSTAVDLAHRLARESLNPSQVDPRARRRIQVERALLRRDRRAPASASPDSPAQSMRAPAVSPAREPKTNSPPFTPPAPGSCKPSPLPTGSAGPAALLPAQTPARPRTPASTSPPAAVAV